MTLRSAWTDAGAHWTTFFVERLWRSVKHEDVYLKGYATMPELRMGLTECFVFYNTERPHQSLDYSTPDHVYQVANGGGARVVDKYSKIAKTHAEMESRTGQHCSAADEQLPS